jgi:phosphoribosylglycinamide formyltransferase-1
MLRLAVFASGRGTNMQAIIDACAAGQLPGVEVALVVTDRRSAPALERARSAGIPTAVVRPRDFADRAGHDRAVAATLASHRVGLICLAGYMRLFGPEFVAAHRGRIINIHPALLPAFPGLDVQRQALEHGVKIAGCTVHFVDEGTDTGPIIVQRAVPVLDDDTVETLSARILEQEHLAYVEAIRLYAAGRLRVEGRRVRVLEPHASPEGG